MDNQITFAHNPNDPVAESILEVYNNLKNNFTTAFDPGFSFNFKEFESFSYNEITSFGPVISVSRPFNSFYLIFVEVNYIISPGRYSSGIHTDFQVWGVLFLKNDYGHILIKPETLLDKIHDLINPSELNFEDDKEFSKKFYVVTNDKSKAESRLSKDFRNQIKNISAKDFIIEIIGNKLIIGNKKTPHSKSAAEFAGFMNAVAAIF